jgi:hypothetical protein
MSLGLGASFGEEICDPQREIAVDNLEWCRSRLQGFRKRPAPSAMRLPMEGRRTSTRTIRLPASSRQRRLARLRLQAAETALAPVESRERLGEVAGAEIGPHHVGEVPAPVAIHDDADMKSFGVTRFDPRFAE